MMPFCLKTQLSPFDKPFGELGQCVDSSPEVQEDLIGLGGLAGRPVEMFADPPWPPRVSMT